MWMTNLILCAILGICGPRHHFPMPVMSEAHHTIVEATVTVTVEKPKIKIKKHHRRHRMLRSRW
jgi:hypothetical protein